MECGGQGIGKNTGKRFVYPAEQLPVKRGCTAVYYVGNLENAPTVETADPEKRIRRCLISPLLDPSNRDIALGMTEMHPGAESNFAWHPEGELFICTSGSGHVRIEDEVIELKENSTVYVPKFAKHQLLADSGDIFTVYWVLTPPSGGDKQIIGLASRTEEPDQPQTKGR